MKLCVKCHSTIENHYETCPDCSGNRFRYSGEYDGTTDEAAKRECELSMTPEPVRCPKCGSRQLAASEQGFGVGKALVGGFVFGGMGALAGFAGSEKLIVNCLNCGHKWKPGKQ